MEGFDDIPVIFLTAMGGEKQKIKGFDLGAVDYIEKSFSVSELSAKIDSLIALRKRQEKQDMKFMKNRLQGLISNLEQNMVGSHKPGFDAQCKKYAIRGREIEITRLLSKGLLYKEIAANLNISLRTVEYNISRIYKKCGVNNKSDLITKFLGYAKLLIQSRDYTKTIQSIKYTNAFITRNSHHLWSVFYPYLRPFIKIW